MMNNYKISTKITFSLLIFLFFFSCKTSKQSAVGNEWNYDNFRKTQLSFNSSDGKIKYIDKGKGEPILLLHGIPTSSWLYRKMIDGLADAGYRVIAPDMLGFGSSDNPKSYGLYTQAEHAKRILELMDHLGLESWNHVMHDAGGLWTWELINKAPEKIKRLILLNTIIYEEGFQPPIKMKPGFFAKASMWGYRNGITTNMLLKQLFKKGLVENNLTKSEIEGYKKPLLENKTNGMYYFFSQTCNGLPNYESAVKKVKAPTTIIWGKHDDMLVLEPQRERLMKDLAVKPEHLHVIEARHFIQEERPQEVNALILDFIKAN